MNPIRCLPLAAAAFCSFAASAEVQWMSHQFNFSLQQSNTADGLKPHPNVVKFYGAAAIAIQITEEPLGSVTNPLYQEKGIRGENPLHDKHARGLPWAQLEAADFISIDIQFTNPTYLVHDGIVHRDIAARNILLSTILGTFSNALGSELAFSSEGPMDYRAAGQPLPIRWSAPEVLPMRLYLNGDASSDQWINIEGGGTFETYSIPTPGAAALLAFAGLPASRRRR
ncbi:MAG: protein kinase [Phycisphaerales bacterium]